ncbi:titin-like [Eupeodes corollae]|uniref:titin-like n=1 Tax=Eupeodes corollae TaxID=290404 RepID=UPI00249004E5|nr:titin-like [Eupeodes corollae]
MEAKYMGLMLFISTLVVVINCQTAENLLDQEIETAIYYGDSYVNIGDPFKITCIIPISEPINWVKDGEPITNHNLRHWRDNHSFITSESAIDGERHKIEAHLSVRHALKAHQGKYQCNTLHSSYHLLKLRKSESPFTKPQLVDSSEEMYFSTQLPDMYLPSVGNTVHQSILLPPHTSAPSISTQKYDMPSQKVTTVYSNATHFNNNMYTLPDEVQSSNSERSFTTTTGRKEHLNVFDKSNITGILLVHPSSFPVSPEYIQMITGRMIEQSTSTEPITIRQSYLPVLPGVTSYDNPTTTFTTATTNNILSQPFLKKEPELLLPNYDNKEHKVKAFDIKGPLVLSCNITKEGDYDLTWEKNGTDVSKVPSLQGRYRIIKPERKFVIERTEEKDAGTYSCVVNGEKKDFRVAAKIVVRVPSNSGVVEGEKLSIHCVVAGTDPQLYWQMGNLTIYNSSGRYELKEDENKVQNAVLTMDNVSLNDRGDYKCLGRNIINDLGIADPAEDISFVRVKGKFAALWPFLGICAEVIILCTIILIYEKRRNKTELEESDTDPNTEQ